MRRTLAIIVAAAAAVHAAPAFACRGPFAETYTFLPALPEAVPSGAVVLKVRPKGPEPAGDTAYVAVDEVISGVWQEDEALIVFGPNTSCSRRVFLVKPSYVVGLPSSEGFKAFEFRLSELRGIVNDGGPNTISPNPNDR